MPPSRRVPPRLPLFASMLLLATSASAIPKRVQQLSEELRDTPQDLGLVFETFVDAFIRHLPGVVTGVALYLLFWLFAKGVVRVVARLMQRAGTEQEARNLLLPLVRFTVLAIGLLMALDQMGFEVRSLLTGLGIAGLAVGLAAQETIANIIAGFSILWDRPFGLGDTVSVAGAQGEVSEIGLRSTRLRTLDNREVILPNKEIVRQGIVNFTRYPQVRLTAAATLAHGGSVESARAAILAAVRRDMPALETPAPQVVVTVLGDLGTTLETRVWVERPETGDRTVNRLLEVVEASLAGAGIELARPLTGFRQGPAAGAAPT